MIAKLNNGVLIPPEEKITIANPPEQLLKDYAGYKDYIESPAPDYDPETQFLEPSYTETDTQIVCSWNVQDIPSETEEENDGV